MKTGLQQPVCVVNRGLGKAGPGRGDQLALQNVELVSEIAYGGYVGQVS